MARDCLLLFGAAPLDLGSVRFLKSQVTGVFALVYKSLSGESVVLLGIHCLNLWLYSMSCSQFGVHFCRSKSIGVDRLYFTRRLPHHFLGQLSGVIGGFVCLIFCI